MAEHPHDEASCPNTKCRLARIERKLDQTLADFHALMTADSNTVALVLERMRQGRRAFETGIAAADPHSNS